MNNRALKSTLVGAAVSALYIAADCSSSPQFWPSAERRRPSSSERTQVWPTHRQSLHGGTAWVEENPGGGTSFLVLRPSQQPER